MNCSADEEETEEGKGEGDDGDGEGEGEEEEEEGEPGCCVLCERLMPLTRHHLIPRSGERNISVAFC